jgi:phage gp45-like
MTDHRYIAMLEQRIERLERKLRAQVTLSRSTAPAVDSGVVQFNQGMIDPLSYQDNMPTLLNYGFSSSLPVGGDKAVMFLNGDRSQGVVVATGHQTYRFKGLLEGESVMYDMWGHSIRMAASAVTVTAPSLVTTGDVVVGTGATGTFTAGGAAVTVVSGIVKNIT